jgi:hypothetical protein
VTHTFVVGCVATAVLVTSTTAACSSDKSVPGSVDKYVIDGRSLPIPDTWKRDGKPVIQCWKWQANNVGEGFRILLGPLQLLRSSTEYDINSAAGKISLLKGGTQVQQVEAGEIEYADYQPKLHAEVHKDGNTYRMSGTSGYEPHPIKTFELDITCPSGNGPP